MPGPLDLSTLFAQLPYAAAAQGAVSGKAEAQQAMLAREVQAKSAHDREKVEKTGGAEAVPEVDEDGRRQSRGEAGQRQRKDGEDAEPPDDQASPWSGKIINLHI